MTVAPELFTPAYAHAALKTYETVLLGPLGVKTLDPADQDYRGMFYVNVLLRSFLRRADE